MSDKRLERALSIADLRRIAQRRLPRLVLGARCSVLGARCSVLEFIDGGAEDEITLADNRAAFWRIGLVPRVLVDVSQPRLETDILGLPAAPFVIVRVSNHGGRQPDGAITSGQGPAAAQLAAAQSAAECLA